MSKKQGQLITMIFIFFMVFYLAYDFALINEMSIITFLSSYLDNFQAYLFIFTLFLLPFFLFTYTPLYIVEYRIRHDKDLFYSLVKVVLVNSLSFSIFLFFSFLLSALLMGFQFVFSTFYIYLMLRLFLFIVFSHLLFYVGYIVYSNVLMGILTVIFTNFLFNATVIGLNFTRFHTVDANIVSNLFFVNGSILLLVFLFVKIKEEDVFL